jgi:hypothetical protein
LRSKPAEEKLYSRGRKGQGMDGLTQHASRRISQRGIPVLIVYWLQAYGEERHDGHGGVIRFFSHRSVKRLMRDVGGQSVRKLQKYLRAYIVEGLDDGSVITAGWRDKRIKS